MKKTFIIFSVAMVALISYKVFFVHSKGESVDTNGRYADLFLEAVEDHTKQLGEQSNVKEYIVSEGDTPAAVFENFGLSYSEVNELVANADGIYDLTQIKIGQPLRFHMDNENVSRIEYDLNSEEMIVAERIDESFDVERVENSNDLDEVFISGEIDRFLYVDAIDAGLPEKNILELADVFSWDVDFTTDIRPGDSFSVVYEKRTRNGEIAKSGKVIAARYTNQGEDYFGFFHEVDGEGGYYNDDGKALEKQFLKAPLNYRRISSGFTSARRHPITKRVTSHYQIDYAAPSGTPVVATATGTVTSARYETGWGRIVRMKHSNGFTTHYAHLSKINVSPGQKLSQNQVVGLVGSTGWSTGPHLDYGVKENGRPINPLTMKAGSAKKLPEGEKENFEQKKEKYFARIQKASHLSQK